MSLKHKVIIFLCTALNLSAATTQETQTDPLPGMYQLPTVQPISFSGAVISQALKAVQIREQALRAEILNEEEKIPSILLKNRFCILWNQKMIDLRKKQKKLGVEANMAFVRVMEQEIMQKVKKSGHILHIVAPYDNKVINQGLFSANASAYKAVHFSSCALSHDNSSSIVLEAPQITFYLKSGYESFLGRSNKFPNEFRLIAFHDGSNIFLEPVEGEYHVDEEGRMMPIFIMVAENKTEEEMKQR